MRQNITSGLIAVIITVITFYFLNNSYKVVEEIEPIKIETPKVDQDFIDDIRGALEEPDIFSDTNERFVSTLDSCIDHVYKSVSEDYQLPKEMIVAQAILESGWGQSRFANEANNLFGIRTFDKSDNWMLPATKKDWTGWGVKAVSYTHLTLPTTTPV